MPAPTVSTASSNGARTGIPGLGTSFSIDGGGNSGFSEIVPGSIVSQNINQSLSQVIQITLTAAQIIAMNATPVTIIPAPGAGKSILVDYIMIRFTYPASGGVQFTGGGAVSAQYSGGAAVATTLPAATITAAASADTVLGNTAANITATQNAAITLTNATAPFAAGNGTLTVFVYYSVL
jgi:hypothetical protein